MTHTHCQVWDGVIPDFLCDTLCQIIEEEQAWLPTSDVKRVPTCGIWCAVIALVQIMLPSHLEPKGGHICVRKSLQGTLTPWHNDKCLTGSHTAIIYLNDVTGGQLEVLGTDGVSQVAVRRGRLVLVDIRFPHRALEIVSATKFVVLILVGNRSMRSLTV